MPFQFVLHKETRVICEIPFLSWKPWTDFLIYLRKTSQIRTPPLDLIASTLFSFRVPKPLGLPSVLQTQQTLTSASSHVSDFYLLLPLPPTLPPPTRKFLPGWFIDLYSAFKYCFKYHCSEELSNVNLVLIIVSYSFYNAYSFSFYCYLFSLFV